MVIHSKEMAVVKYIGHADFAPGIWVGLELRNPKGNHFYLTSVKGVAFLYLGSVCPRQIALFVNFGTLELTYSFQTFRDYSLSQRTTVVNVNNQIFHFFC